MLSLAMALGLLLPTTMNAQTDGFFRGGGENYENRDVNPSGSLSLGPTQYENPSEAPIGSGLLILTIAGAGYVALKKKEAVK
ncbi:MAG: hypothetical protein IJT45_07820 [Bacteroidales bacterium]|nr:hypothetical protein [Bacteroidales bacterium]